MQLLQLPLLHTYGALSICALLISSRLDCMPPLMEIVELLRQEGPPAAEQDDDVNEKDTHSLETQPLNRAAYAFMMLLGFTMLVPWSVLLNAIPYFQQLYPEQVNGIAFYMTAGYLYPQIPLLFLLVSFGPQLSFRARLTLPFAIQAFAIALVSVAAPSSMWGMLAVVFVVGITTAVVQTSGFAFARYGQAIVTGQGVAGILSCLSKMAFIPIDNPSTEAYIYFAFAGVVLAAGAACFELFYRSAFARPYLKRGRVTAANSSSTAKSSPTIHEAQMDTTTDAEGRPLLADDISAAQVEALPVLRKVWVMAATVFNVFLLTFLVYPAIIPALTKYRGTWGASVSDDWWNSIQLLIFNVFDTIGRYTSQWPLNKGKPLLAGTFLRYALVPIFYGIAHSYSTSFFNDTTLVICIALLSYTNGYMASIAMVYGPRDAHPHEREKAGFILTTSLQMGALIGSQISYAFTGGPTTS